MTRDDVIRMAREAGASFETAESMFSFAALVAAAEREACVAIAKEAVEGGDRQQVRHTSRGPSRPRNGRASSRRHPRQG